MNARLLFVCMATGVVAHAQFAQQGPKLVGSGGSGNSQQGWAVSVSADGNTAIVGSYSNGAWVFTRTSGVWTQQGARLFGTGAVGVSSQGQAVAISGDGNTAMIGSYTDNGDTGAVWVFIRSNGTWSQQGNKIVATGFGGVGRPYFGYSTALSADGNLAIVGTLNDNNGVGSAYIFRRTSGVWSQGAKLIGSGGQGVPFQGRSVSLSADGNTALVGGYFDNSEAGATWVFFRNAGLWSQQGPKLVGTGGIGQARQGSAVALSANGNVAIVGAPSDNAGKGAAWMFVRDNGVWTQVGNKFLGAGAVGSAYQGAAVSLDSSGTLALIGGLSDNASIGASWLFRRSGGTIQQIGFKLVGTGAVGTAQQGSSVALSADGRTAICGGQFDNGGIGAAWVFIPQGLAITRPAANEVVLAGSEYEIRWNTGSGIDSVSIDVSLDSGKTYPSRFTLRSTPNTGSIHWLDNDTLSSKCVMRIRNVQNPSDSTITRFRIKGYVLTRFTQDGSYERFSPVRDNWVFGNSRVNMWPQSWWSQFDYVSGIDPYTGSIYPLEFIIDLDAESSNFADWSLFVRAFTVQNCYWNTSTRQYKQSALLKWRVIKDSTWSGSCSGFAKSSLLAFSHRTALRDSFPELGSVTHLNQIPLTNETRKVINQIQTYGFGSEHQTYRAAVWKRTPRETLQELKDMLFSDVQSPRTLTVDDYRPGSHSIVPYKLYPINPNGGYSIFAYDPNIPGDSTFAEIDSVANRWVYYGYRTYSDTTEGLYLEDPVDTYLRHPAMRASDMSNMPATGQLEIYTPQTNAIRIQDQNGGTIGFQDSTIFQTIPNAMPIVPITSVYEPPIGYRVPNGQYAIRQSNFTDTLTYLSVFSDSLIYSYQRSGAQGTHADKLYLNNGLSMVNSDNVAKRLNLTTIISSDTIELTFKLSNLTSFSRDSLSMKEVSRRELSLGNFGRAKTYNLRLDLGSRSRGTKFLNATISLDSNSSHRIVPNWNSLQTEPVKILIDRGNNGTIDDSIFVNNQTSDVPLLNTGEAPVAFSLQQNYPNPFNPTTTIEYDIPLESDVRLAIYDVLGEEVATLVNGRISAGRYHASWNATNIASGIYFYRLSAFNNASKPIVLIKKLIVLK